MVEGQRTELGDGFQRGEGLIDTNGQTGWGMCQLLFDVVCFAITWGQEESKRRRGNVEGGKGKEDDG